MKRALGSFILAIAAAVAAVILYANLAKEDSRTVVVRETPAARFVNLPTAVSATPPDFITAAETAVHAVVHVKTKASREASGNPLYDFFYGYRGEREEQPVTGYGSGVILTSDGYVVTNNHVIERSDEVEVTLNDKRAFDAEVIGTDPSTDLAVLKIKSSNLPFIKFGESDDLRLGEWVLAVGNPYNLTSTVTAGIVSAKARNVGILMSRDRLSIESFIQTDAAVNPGNSGGALVNTRGELVGINAAIISRTGGFSGYSFAIPTSIVQKVVEDLIEYGTVQRALLGVIITELDAERAREYDVDIIEGVLVTGLSEGGAAKDAGMEAGDVITAINGVRVNSSAELQEQVSRYRPNDRISVTYKRSNRTLQRDVVLRNPQGGTGLVKKQETIASLGAGFDEVGSSELRKLNIDNGLKVVEIRNGKFRNAGIREGFIVTEINNQPIGSAEDIKKIIESADRGLYIEGVYPDGLVAYYAIRL